MFSFDEWLSRNGLAEVNWSGCVQSELRALAVSILALRSADEKVAALRQAFALVQQDGFDLDVRCDWRENDYYLNFCPGIPERPILVAATDTPRRGLNTLEGLRVTIHALAHIEFNAINLALDAMVRFPGLSVDYYWDWWRVAAEESYHFSLLENYLRDLGCAYGDYPAHSGLWDMAERTQASFADRMAMVPRTLEARGLDACPLLQAKFRAAGEMRAVDILDVILRDEISHVALGHRWFVFACMQREVTPIREYKRLCALHHAPRLRPPLNIVARRAAGFFDEELAQWQSEDF